jgi:hypothetical protein
LVSFSCASLRIEFASMRLLQFNWAFCLVLLPLRPRVGFGYLASKVLCLASILAYSYLFFPGLFPFRFFRSSALL